MTRKDYLTAIWAAEDTTSEMRIVMADYDHLSCEAREANTVQPRAFYDGMAETRAKMNLAERELTLWREKLQKFDDAAWKEPNPFDEFIP